MTTIDIITDIIKEDADFKTLRFNVKTNKIEISKNNEEYINFSPIYSSSLLKMCQEKWPDNKFKKSDINEAINIWCTNHIYKPVKETCLLHIEEMVVKEKPTEETSVEETPTKESEKAAKIREAKTATYKKFPDWGVNFTLNDKGKIEQTVNNIHILFNNHDKWKDKWLYNEFTNEETFNGEPIEDGHVSKWLEDVEKLLGFYSRPKLTDAFVNACRENTVNPYKSALEKILWDGQERAETLFIDFLGAEDTALNRTLTKKWLYGMIKRLYEPGCDFDYMLIIHDSTQGTGKTKLMKRLVQCLGVPYGYDTSISCSQDKDNIDKLNKTWVAAIDELTTFIKLAPEAAKQFLSTSEDTARLSYAHRSKTYKRHCVFYATTNVDYFLKDYTDNFERRYWILDAHGQKHDPNWWETNCPDSYLRQVLAEMYQFYKLNPKFDCCSLTLEQEEELIAVQERHKTINNDDVIIEKIRYILDKYYTTTNFNSMKEFISAASSEDMPVSEETLKFFNEDMPTDDAHYLTKIPTTWLHGLVEDTLKRGMSTPYLTKIMSRLNWDKKAAKYNGKKENCYVRL